VPRPGRHSVGGGSRLSETEASGQVSLPLILPRPHPQQTACPRAPARGVPAEGRPWQRFFLCFFPIMSPPRAYVAPRGG